MEAADRNFCSHVNEDRDCAHYQIAVLPDAESCDALSDADELRPLTDGNLKQRDDESQHDQRATVRK